MRTSICVSILEADNKELVINKTNEKWRHIYHEIARTKPIKKHSSEGPLIPDSQFWLPSQLQLFQRVEHQVQEGSGNIYIYVSN